MRIINPFQIYLWKSKSLLILVLAISFSMWGSICLDLMGLQIPLLRQLIGIIYLLFLPGVLILRILGLDKLDNIESLLYTVGLSVSFVMVLGFITNQLYMYFGILNPISVIPLMIMTNLIIIIFCSICCYRDKKYYSYYFIPPENFFSPKFLFLLIIPFLAIFGTYIVNVYHNNHLIIIYLLIISLLILLFGFTSFFPKNLYPVVIFIMGISLLFYNGLISNYIWGCDIQREYYVANLVKHFLIWNPYYNRSLNAMLSLVILSPVISNICNIDLVWVFKIIYPLLFSLVPLGMYRIAEKQTTEEIAFLSCIYFISGFVFYTEMLALARQQISELFFILFVILILNSSILNFKKAILSIIFLFSMAISHYGLSYIFLLALLFSVMISRFILVIDIIYLLIVAKLTKMKHNKYLENIQHKKFYSDQESFEKTISINFIVLAFIFILSWYIYTTDGVIFTTIVNIGYGISDKLVGNFGETQGAAIVTKSAASSMRDITKYLHIISIFFISLGVLKLSLKRREMQFNNTYTILSFAYFIICVFGFVVPFFASQLNTSRVYHISLLILAPLFSIGSISLFNVVIHMNLNYFWANVPTKKTLSLLSLFLSIFFLFNSGLIYEINNEESSSVALNSTHYPFIYNDEEVLAANWININKDLSSLIYADLSGANLLGSINPDAAVPFFKEDISSPKNGSILLTTLNIDYRQLYVVNESQLEYIDIEYLTNGKKISSIYSNGYAEIDFYN